MKEGDNLICKKGYEYVCDHNDCCNSKCGIVSVTSSESKLYRAVIKDLMCGFHCPNIGKDVRYISVRKLKLERINGICL